MRAVLAAADQKKKLRRDRNDCGVASRPQIDAGQGAFYRPVFNVQGRLPQLARNCCMPYDPSGSLLQSKADRHRERSARPNRCFNFVLKVWVWW